MAYNNMPVQRLYYIAHIQNVISILDHGILSYKRAKKLNHESFALQGVQDRRHKISVIGTATIHDYANLYYNPRNTTMYKIMKAGNAESHVILGISKDVVLKYRDVWYSNMNAACKDAIIICTPILLKKRYWDVIMGESWDDEDPEKKKWKKAVMCSEVLIRDKVDARFINNIYAPSDMTMSKLKRMGISLPIVVDPHMFFLPLKVGTIR